MTILTPRKLQEFRIQSMMQLSIAAGWNQTEADWLRILRLSPDLCFGIELDNTLAASATAIVRKQQTAWIGMVLTLPEYRGRGLARLLLTHLLSLVDQQSLQYCGLDATTMGAPLYQSLGFKEDRPIERWYRSGKALKHLNSDPLQPTSDPLLDDLAVGGTVLTSAEATLYLRPGRIASYLGPFFASSTSAAVNLTERIPQTASLYWDLFPDNPSAVALATAMGLEPSRKLMRMFRGNPLPPQHTSTLAIAGFEFG